MTDFAAGTFEGGTELNEGRLVVAPPASGPGAPVSDALLELPRAGHAAAMARGFVFIVGGDGPVASTARARFQPGGLEAFQPERPLPAPRTGAAAAASGAFLFVSGGSATADVWVARVEPDGALGPWTSTTPLPQALEGHAMVAARGALYVVGGTSSGGVTGQTWRAEVGSDGTLSAWTPDTSLPTARTGCAAVLLGDRLAVLGGSAQVMPTRVDLSDVVSAEFLPGGRLGPWRAERPLPRPRGSASAVATRQALVVLGGFDGLGEVWFAPVQAGGSLGDWRRLATMPAETGAAAAVTFGRWAAVLGGRSPSSAPTPRLQLFALDDGAALSAFAPRSPADTGLQSGAAVAARSTLFLIGGTEGGTVVSGVRRWAIAPGGLTPLPFTTLPRALTDVAAVFRDTELYVIGGRDDGGVPSDEVLASTVTENGGLSAWTVRARLPTARARVGATVEGDQLVVVGGDDGALSADVLTAAFLADGGLGAFVRAGALPSARSGVAVSSRVGHLLVAGGETASGPSLEVLTAPLGPGTVGPWSSNPPLPSPRVRASAAVHGGQVVLVGGAGSDVVAARWHSDGRVTAFSPLGTVPELRPGLAAAVAGDELFVAGGDVARPVVSARLAPVASAGTFVAGPSLPAPRRAARLVSTATHVYLLGGSSPSADFADVLVAARQPDDTLGPWVPTTPLPQGRYLHVALVAGRRLYVLGGTTGMGPTADALTAPLLDDGGVGDWTPTTPLPDAGNEAAGAVVGDSLFVMGGQAGPASDSVVRATVLSDGGLSSWSPTTSLPRARWGHASTTVDTRVLVAGGQPDDTASQESLPDVLAAEAYADGGLGPWRRVGTLAGSRRNFSLLSRSGVVLALGGVDRSTATRLNDVEAAPMLDDGTLGPFVTVAAFPTARRHPVAALVGDRLVVGTGVGPPIQTHLGDTWVAPLALPRALGAWSGVVDLGAEARTVESFRLVTRGLGRVRVESAVLGLDGGFEPAERHGVGPWGAPIVIARPGRGLRVWLQLEETSAFTRDLDGGRFGLDAIEVEWTAEDAGPSPDASVDAGPDGGPEPSDGGDPRPPPGSYAVGCGCQGGDGAAVAGLALLSLALWRARRRR